MQCSECGLFFPRIRTDKNFLKKYYPHNYYSAKRSIIRYLEKTYTRFCFFWSRQLIITKMIKKERILDFGCGRGEFLASLTDYHQKFGVEISGNARRLIKKESPELKVYSDLNDPGLGFRKFDLITLWHVIEHLEKPREVLAKLTTRLKRDGLMIISTPNSDSFGLRLGRDSWFHLDTPRHLQIFNQYNLGNLLKDFGLKIIKVKGSRWEYPLDVFWTIYRRFQTKHTFLNVFLAFLILPLSFIVKLTCLIDSSYSEIITLVVKKA